MGEGEEMKDYSVLDGMKYSQREAFNVAFDKGYKQGYEDGQKQGHEDERIKGTYGMSVEDIQKYFGDIEKFKKMSLTERIARAYEDGFINGMLFGEMEKVKKDA